jgi:hypothetical protein
MSDPAAPGAGEPDLEAGSASPAPPVQVPAVRPLLKQKSLMQSLADTLFDDGEDEESGSGKTKPAAASPGYRPPAGGLVRMGMQQRNIGELTASRFKVWDPITCT